MRKLFTLVFFSLLFFACKKDPCHSTHCLNGGTCIDGSCNCPGGYSGPNCENYDPCYGVFCQNGGTCINGQCNCPPGYSGPDCATRLSPTQMKITRVSIDHFPLTNNEAGWDLNSGPDIYLTINPGTIANVNTFRSSYNYTDQLSPFSFQGNDGLPYAIKSPNDNWSIAIWDHDITDPDDLMGGFYFVPNKYAGTEIPSTIHLSGGGYDFTLYVEWVF